MKFEYTIIAIKSAIPGSASGTSFTKSLNAIGEEGWELVEILDKSLLGELTAIFKREKPSQLLNNGNI